MHLVDALARMQLTATGQPASSVPLVYQGKKMTLLKGDAALAARRAVASKLDHRAIPLMQLWRGQKETMATRPTYYL